jgi:hypothetical protein
VIACAAQYGCQNLHNQMQGAKGKSDDARYIQHKPKQDLGGCDHPDVIVESASLSAVDPPHISATLPALQVCMLFMFCNGAAVFCLLSKQAGPTAAAACDIIRKPALGRCCRTMLSHCICMLASQQRVRWWRRRQMPGQGASQAHSWSLSHSSSSAF